MKLSVEIEAVDAKLDDNNGRLATCKGLSTYSLVPA